MSDVTGGAGLGPGHTGGRRRRLARLTSLTVLALVSVATATGHPPLDLAASISHADSGPDVRVARLQWEAAVLAAAAAGAQINASARTGYGVGWRDGVPTDASGPTAITLSATLNVVPLGARGEAAERAAVSLARATSSLEATRAIAAIGAAERWWSARRAADDADLATWRLEVAQRALAVVRVQAEAGTAATSAVMDALLDLGQAELDLIGARANEAATLLELSIHIGRPVAAIAPRGAATDAEALALLDRYELPDDAERGAAVSASDRVANARQALEDAIAADVRAARETSPSLSVSASYGTTGATGRASVAASWDTRSYQPSLELLVDPFRSSAPTTTASVSIGVSVPLSTAHDLERQQASLAITIARERLELATALATLEIAAQVRAAEATLGQLALALERSTARELQAASLTLRAEFDQVSALELERAAADRRAADLALDRAFDAARITLARLDLAVGRDPLLVLGLAASPTPSEVD
jgi:outer membrane protein TolC